MPEKFSYSKLDTYCQCPFKYYLQYVKRNFVYTDTVATLFGSALHKAEESIAKCIMAGEKVDYMSIKADFEQSAHEIYQKFPLDFNTPDKSKKTYEEKTNEYIQKGIYRLENFINKFPAVKIVGAEIPFEIIYKENYLLHGFIDRAFFDNLSGTYLIQDIKTYSKTIEKKKLEAPLQFVIYTLAGETLFNTERTKIYCQYDLPLLNKTQQVSNFDFMQKGIEDLDKVLRAIDRQDFLPEPSALCAWCQFSKTNPDAQDDVKLLCPYHSKWQRDTKNRNDLAKSEFEWMGLANHEKILEVYQEQNKPKKPENILFKID